MIIRNIQKHDFSYGNSGMFQSLPQNMVNEFVSSWKFTNLPYKVLTLDQMK